jgi:hypothetical protein
VPDVPARLSRPALTALSVAVPTQVPGLPLVDAVP